MCRLPSPPSPDDLQRIIQSPAWEAPPKAALRASYLVGEGLELPTPLSTISMLDEDANSGERHTTGIAELGELDNSRNGSSQPPPARPSTPTKPYMKCAACRGFSLHALSQPTGYRHLDDWQYLEQSSESCRLCNLIWEARETRKMYRKKIRAGKVQWSPRGMISPLTCTLDATDGTPVMIVRSADFEFRSTLAVYVKEGSSSSGT